MELNEIPCQFSGCGRLAPSPTGAQHLGNARTFLIAWLDARCRGAKLLLRIEDLDTPRTKSWATDQTLEDLRWCGLDWDVQVPKASERHSRYLEILDQLQREHLIYPCTCTRSEIEQASSAPHESILDGAAYPGTCRSQSAQDASRMDREGVRYAWRFRFPQGTWTWRDELHGSQSLERSEKLGDFVVARNYGPIAYQLAVVVDDHDQGVTRVVRGDDLMYSTYRQLAIHAAMHWSPPDYLHVPLIVGEDGRRLAKRHGDTRIAFLREQKIAPERLMGYLAWSLGWMDQGARVTPRDLCLLLAERPGWQSRLPTKPWVFRWQDL